MDGDIEAKRRHDQPPACGIACPARVSPIPQHLDAHIIPRQRASVSRGVDPGSRAVGIFGAAAVAKRIEHQARAIGELQPEPVPPGLLRPEAAAAPFPVEPGEAVDLERLAVADDDSTYRDSWDGIVVGRIARLSRLATQPAVSVEDGRHQRPRGKRHDISLLGGLKPPGGTPRRRLRRSRLLPVTPADLPVADPDPERVRLRAREPERTP